MLATVCMRLADLAGAVEQRVVGVAVQVDERSIGHGLLTAGEGLLHCTVSHGCEAEKGNDPTFRESYRRMESILTWWNAAEVRAFVNRTGTAMCIFIAFWICRRYSPSRGSAREQTCCRDE